MSQSDVVLTGIGPESAQNLVGLGVDMGGTITRATLKDGIAAARRAQDAAQPHGANGAIIPAPYSPV